VTHNSTTTRREMMRLIVVSVFVILLSAVVTSAPLAKNKLSPAVSAESDVVDGADRAADVSFDIDNRPLLAERHGHEDHNRGHHSQRADTEDKAIRHNRRPADRSPPTHSGQDGDGQQEDWRQYVPAAYRKYLPDESSTAAASSRRSHSKSPRSRSHKSLIDDRAAAADAAVAAVELVDAAAAVDQQQVLAEADAVPMSAHSDAVGVEEQNVDVEAEKVAVVSTTSSLTWFLILIVVVILTAGGIAVAAYIANRKQSDYAPLPTREIY